MVAAIDLEAFRKARALDDTQRRIDRLAILFARQMSPIYSRIVRRDLAEVIRSELKRSKAKDDEDTKILRELMIRFGLRQMIDAANAEAGSNVIHGTLITDALAGKEIKITYLQEWLDGIDAKATNVRAEVRDQIRESVRTIIAEAESAGNKPTVSEVTRRIQQTIHAVEPETGAQEGRTYVFSWGRAMQIARTETAQVQNTGKIAGFEVTGVEEIEWLAYSDGKSGDRHHERMHKKRVKLGDYFTTPLGNRLRYPCDPMGAAEDIVNCRCNSRPAR